MHMDWADYAAFYGVDMPRTPARWTGSPLSAQITAAAQTLAGKIEGGEYNELLPESRTGLRALSMTMSVWADLVDTMEVERLPKRRAEPIRARIGRILSKLRRF